jgi:hypothetical protein
VVVDLPRPRTVEMITSPRFAAVEEELLAALRGGSRRGLAAGGQ